MMLRSAIAEMKFRILYYLLEAAKKQRLAKKLYAGWKVRPSAVPEQCQYQSQADVYCIVCGPLTLPPSKLMHLLST